MPGIERPGRRTTAIDVRPITGVYGTPKAGLRLRNPNKSSLHDVIQNRRKALRSPQTFVSKWMKGQWWSQTGSNRRPPACKAGALPAELWPLIPLRMVGLGGLEPPTSRLSSARSNQLSYKPSDRAIVHEAKPRKAANLPKEQWPSRLAPRPRGAPAAKGCGTARERRSIFIHEERETKAADPALVGAMSG